ncbi:cupin domain-containing protein [Gordonia metallireducens]|uniref:cupin domain-containing protein n=1 Tax=Gordonia metallireducens TaxID=2897779 RepID=UPI001E4F5971|nr:cupin domain-containing protein [Gordonia metallireducens]
MTNPIVVPIDGCPVSTRETNGVRMTLARTITHADHGSKLMAGISWMNPGDVSAWWSTESQKPLSGDYHHIGPVDEIFYLIQGELVLETGAGGAGIPFRAGDTVFFPTEGRFRIRNNGTAPATLFYVETPPLG